MEREIKFRVWDKEKNMWTNFKIFDNSTFFMDKNTGVWFNKNHKEYERFELMQYTGLKDKNGKEIYEGDVVKLVHFKDGRKKETGKVIFLHSQAGFGIIDRDGNEYPLFRNTAKQIEIIENIQENKR